jgi:D-tagatose-1,6-bisphosphate aldolase subunit GatZ/KbaZ
MKQFQALITANKRGEKKGIYAICSAHPLVLEAAIIQAKNDNSVLLIEATANQVNQYGGYTGMLPADFIAFVKSLALQLNFNPEQLIFGGDHLGPVCWCNETAASAMIKAEQLIRCFVAAGFKKIHLDTSMRCADDETILADSIVAERAAQLCLIAENTAISHFGVSDLVYVIGTEVPPPGGANEKISTLEVTKTTHVAETLSLHEKSFYNKELESAWQRVVGLFVQPGVEFDNTQVFDYDTKKAQQLKSFISMIDGIAFEAHSTDYQNAQAYHDLISDHFAILKVGPELTFALREALLALSQIEQQLFPIQQQSHLQSLIEQNMLNKPEHWQRFYQVDNDLQLLYRQFSYSDRVRYYWGDPNVMKAVDTLFSNLSAVDLPLPLLSQYLPIQYQAIRNAQLKKDAKSIVIHHIMQVTNRYAQACFNAA